MLGKRRKDYIQSLQVVMSTKEGKRMLAYWKEDYLQRTVLGNTPEITHYNAGIHDFVMNVLMDAKLDIETFDNNVKTITEENYEY